MRTLVAITSCMRDAANGVNQAVRDTWASKLHTHNIDYRFFIGNGKTKAYDPRFLHDLESHRSQRPADANAGEFDARLLKGDEVVVDAPDSWLYLAHKIQESRRWAISKGYDYIFKIDVDCLLDVTKFATSDYQKFDYWGSRADTSGPLVYAGGWMGYCLSRKAAQLTVNAPVTRVTEDCWTAEALRDHGIVLKCWTKPPTIFLSLGHAKYTADAIRRGIKPAIQVGKPAIRNPFGLKNPPKVHRKVYRTIGMKTKR